MIKNKSTIKIYIIKKKSIFLFENIKHIKNITNKFEQIHLKLVIHKIQ